VIVDSITVLLARISVDFAVPFLQTKKEKGKKKKFEFEADMAI
jgi:hypothetical protein